MTKHNALLLIIVLMLNGCTSTSQPIPPDALNHYRDTLVDLGVKSSEAMTVEYKSNYSNFKERVKTQDQTDPNPLTLRFCGGRFEWKWGDCDADQSTVPVFNVIARSRADLAKLNGAMVDYANFLILFNAANENSKANLDAAADKIGATTQSIASRFGVELDEAKMGAFANLGSNAVQQLLAKKQRQGMAAVMLEFQPGVKYFSGLGSQAMAISAAGIKDEYNEENRKTARKIVTEDDGKKRLALVEKLLELNEQTSTQLDSLGMLAAAYESIPGAHRELMAAIESGRHASLSELVGYIEMISNIAVTYKKSDTE